MQRLSPQQQPVLDRARAYRIGRPAQVLGPDAGKAGNGGEIRLRRRPRRARGHALSPAGGPDLPVEDAPLEVVNAGEKSLGRTADQDLSVAAAQPDLERDRFSGTFAVSGSAGERVAAFLDYLVDLGVEATTISPGFSAVS